jgi:hypothetical protein
MPWKKASENDSCRDNPEERDGRYNAVRFHYRMVAIHSKESISHA